MFAPDIERWLEGNSTPGYRQFLVESRTETADLLREVGVPRNCELADFYLRHGAATCRGWYEINEPDQIADATQYVQEEWAVPEGFIALTSTEGEGVVLYALETGAVYDVELGRLDDFLGGSLEPVASTFEGYLRWCMGKAR